MASSFNRRLPCPVWTTLILPRITTGAALLSYVHRTPEVSSYFTARRGRRASNSVRNEPMGLKPCGTFPTCFPSYQWQPTMHVNVRESNYLALDVMKWNGLPSELGGTGTMAS